MPITHSEVHGSLDGVDSVKRDSRGKLMYILKGSDSLGEMRAYILAQGLKPTVVDDLIYETAERSRLGPRIWLWTFNYVERNRADEGNDKIDVGEFRISFVTKGGAVKMFWKPDYENRVTAEGAAPIHYLGAINVRDGKPEGVEILIPALKFTIHYRHPKTVDAYEFLQYGRDLASITARTNLLAFYGFDPGEVLYLGAAGSNGIDSDPVLDHEFAASKNLTDIIIGELAPIDKNGHAYLWVDWEPQKESTTKMIRPKPRAVYVHELYEPVDYALIGVGS